MIDKISFKNYKIFKEKQTLELRPITVIIGKNNTGKSAIVRLPTLIEGAFPEVTTYRNKDRSTAIKLVNNGLKLGERMTDLVYGNNFNLMEFELTDTNQTKLKVGILIYTEQSVQKPQIDYWEIDDIVNFRITLNDADEYDELISRKRFTCLFNGLYLDKLLPDDKELFQKVSSSVSPEFHLTTDYIGPIRTTPTEPINYSDYNWIDRSGYDGRNMYSALIQDSLTTDQKVLRKVSSWYKENFDGWELGVSQIKSSLFEFFIQKGNLRQNIINAGMGIFQVLPIVTRAFAPLVQESLIIIEEPESHLHPAAHGNVAQLLVESLGKNAKNDKQDGSERRYLVETHSLNFVLRLRRLVAEGMLNKDDLAIYYVDFDAEANCSKLKPIEVDNYGKVSYWPEGVFNETLNETIALMSARKERLL